MKTFYLVFFLVPVFLYGQTVWTPPVIIEDITVNAADKIVSYSDANGNHLVINSSGTITYYRLNIEGGLETSVVIDNGCEYSNYTVAITAYQDELYIAYQKGIYIKVVKSVNGGDTWNSLTQKEMLNSICNGIDAVYDEKGLHVVWAVKRQSDDFFETYYERYRRIDPDWIEFQQITDDGYTGGRPTIALSENRIHVNYNIYSGYELSHNYYLYLFSNSARTRDFNFISNEWELSQLVSISEPTLPFPCEVESWANSAEKIIVHNGYLHVISFVWVFPYPWTCALSWLFVYDKRRPVNSSNWESETVISRYSFVEKNMPVAISLNQKLNIIFITRVGSALAHFQYSNNNWSEEIYIADYNEETFTNFSLSAADFTLFAFWISENNELWYSQSPKNPAAPLEANQINPLLNTHHDFFEYKAEIFLNMTDYLEINSKEGEKNEK